MKGNKQDTTRIKISEERNKEIEAIVLTCPRTQKQCYYNLIIYQIKEFTLTITLFQRIIFKP